MLLNVCASRFGLRGSALTWIESYLTDRVQSVLFNNTLSEPLKLTHGVPQGSILGPILFNIYITPLCDLLRVKNVDFQFYADDSLLHFKCKRRDFNYRENVERILNEVTKWFKNMGLKLNEEKTEILCVERDNGASRVESLCVAENIIPVNSTLKTLGITFDSTLSFASHISRTVSL